LYVSLQHSGPHPNRLAIRLAGGWLI
jgi:hypothetical protein